MPDTMIERERWEYMTIQHEVDDSELNKNGAQGWEAVSVYVLHESFIRTLFKRRVIDAALAEELDEDDSEPDFSSARTGDICSRSGDIKGHPIGSGYGITSYGEVHVSPEQADAAAAYGWKRVNKRERDPARVLIRR